ncbi:MAG TPA: hypothetical protein ENJ79_05440 [Gammaproteobacteria bacterium]|nr:hypothetical protein [Gammaproteobacteria bacterium]
MRMSKILDLVGVGRHHISYRDNLLSAIGGFLGIFGIFVTAQWLLDPEAAVLIVPSMGASAVLLFAAPHAPFSQPWNVLGGHAISAIIGVACWKWIPDHAIAASASVGLSIGAMYLAHCLHPPGGATALAAVIGSERLHQLGFSYEYAPILLNTLTILLVAIAFNAFFAWRRYPVHWHQKKPPFGSETKTREEDHAPIRHEDFVYALSHIDTFVDIAEEDLVKIYELATRRKVGS